ncbi:MAG: hypothetical protein KatS3mg110_2423 [Pirellulaceae bacterium]|nr:MAG: hypothetical protein KatS3mg110_2423 [Pirellulaceae bacterium]
MSWRTVIEIWDPPWRFIDVQEKGPYKTWRHTHRFIQVRGGTELQDEVVYELPLGVVGRVVHEWVVKRDLDAIFDYREKTIREIFERASLHGCKD